LLVQALEPSAHERGRGGLSAGVNDGSMLHRGAFASTSARAVLGSAVRHTRIAVATRAMRYGRSSSISHVTKKLL
jgi:hypothetical protein